MSRALAERFVQELLRTRASRQLLHNSQLHKMERVASLDTCSSPEAFPTVQHESKDNSLRGICPMAQFNDVPRRQTHFVSGVGSPPHLSIDVQTVPGPHVDGLEGEILEADEKVTTLSTGEVPAYLAFDDARPFSEMPVPFSLPVIGTSWLYMPGGPLYGLCFEEKIKKLHEMYGPIIRENVLLNFVIVHVFKPEDIEAVYRVQGRKPIREGFRMLQKYNDTYNDGIQGIITSQGDAWHRLRSKSQVKMLKPKSVSAYLKFHNSVASDLVASISRLRDKDGVIESLLPELYKFAMEGIGCVCFNRRLGALETNIPADSDTFRFIQAVNDVMSATHTEFKSVFLSKWSRGFRKLARAQSFIIELSTREVMRTLEMFALNQLDKDCEECDLIPYLMTKTGFTEQEVITIISEFFFAGVDTTSHFLGFTLYALARNPDVQDKLIKEIDKVTEGCSDISTSNLGQMTYLKAVIKEAFRVTPITPGNGRTLQTDVVLSGYRVPAGIMVGLHHDWVGKSSLYIRQPDHFLPERWLRGNASSTASIHPFSVMPFGFGPRACVGRRFAEQEFSLGLIKILQKFTVEYMHYEDLRYDMCLVNKPLTPLKFRFVDRK